MKKYPCKLYEKETKNKAIIGTMASDSMQRESSYLKTGCNNFEKGSAPLSFWLEQDIWDYIKKYELPYCKVYDTGVTNTGCVYCMFGVHLEKEPNRFQLMQKTHPNLYNYCMNKLELNKILDFISVSYTKDEVEE